MHKAAVCSSTQVLGAIRELGNCIYAGCWSNYMHSENGKISYI